MDLGITLSIFLNTVFMMMEYYPQDDDHKQVLDTANYVSDIQAFFLNFRDRIYNCVVVILDGNLLLPFEVSALAS